MQASQNREIIELLEAEAKNLIVEKARHQGSSLEKYYSGREAGILFALDHLKKGN